MQKAKILIVGPTESGKTTIANFLSDAGEVGSSMYRPTRGCRIVEFEVPNVTINELPAKAEVEVWDVSGDMSFNHAWPAIQMGTNGVIFVYNPDKEEHPRVLDSLHNQFVAQQRLKEKQCIVFCHSKPESRGHNCKLSNTFSGISQVETEVSEEGSNRLRMDFSGFLGDVLSHMSDIADKNEASLLL